MVERAVARLRARVAVAAEMGDVANHQPSDFRTAGDTRAPVPQLMISQSAPTRPMVMLARIQAVEVVVASQNLIV